MLGIYNGEGIVGTSGCSLTSHGPNLLVVGGWNPDYHDALPNTFDAGYVRKIYRYNLYSGVCNELRCYESGLNCPIETACHCAFALSDHELLFLGGSLSPLGFLQSSKRIYIYSIKTQSWQEIQCSSEEGDTPPSNIHHWWGRAAFLHGDTLTIATGDQSRGQMLIHQLKLSRREFRWIKVEPADNSPLQFPLVKHQIIVYDEKVFVFGGSVQFDNVGFAERIPFSLGNLPTFDLRTRKWSLTQCTGPESVLGLWPFAPSVVLDGNFVFLTGGKIRSTVYNEHDDDLDSESESEDEIGRGRSGLLSSVLLLDMRNLKWNIFSTTSGGRFFHASCLCWDGRLCVYGGCVTRSYSGGPRSNRFEFVQCRVPSLWHIALREFFSGIGAKYTAALRNATTDKLHHVIADMHADGVPLFVTQLLV